MEFSLATQLSQPSPLPFQHLWVILGYKERTHIVLYLFSHPDSILGLCYEKGSYKKEREHSCFQKISSTFQRLPFHTAPQAMVTPNYKMILLLLPNCSFATVVNHNVNI